LNSYTNLKTLSAFAKFNAISSKIVPDSFVCGVYLVEKVGDRVFI